MRISKFLAAAFVAAFFAGSLQAQPTDSDVQSKAREALRQAEANQSTPVTPATPAVTPPPKVMKTPPPQVIVAPPPVVEIAPAPAPLSGGLSPDAEAKARAAMRAAMADSTPVTPRPMVATPVTPVVAAPPAKYNSPTSVSWDQVPGTAKPIPAPANGNTTVVQTVTPTPAPVMTPAMISKQQRLADLLNRYKMDQISPQEYFQQKSKILSEP